MQNKLLIVAPYQFGELSDCYYWAKYASLAGWNVTYLGYRYRQRQINERAYPGVKVVGVMHSRNRILHGLKFLGSIICEIILNNHKNIIVCRFPKCELLAKIFIHRNIVLDVRTLSVSENKRNRELEDGELKKIMREFKTISVISKGVSVKLGGDCFILPLGAEPLSSVVKDFQTMRLFYIGTFNNRNLAEFIEGLALYQKESQDETVTFDIVGGGSESEENLIKSTIIKTGVKGVKLHGYLTHDEAQIFFDNSNIGVCYVPVTDYYQHQPPTKLYEYLLSGMACIATDTISNISVINNNNGIIIHDNPKSVCDGLCEIKHKLGSFHSEEIVLTSQKYHWKTIVEESLFPILK